MANPYALEQIDQPAANDAAGDNPYAIRAIESDSRTQLRGSLLSGQSANPDQTAEAVKLARKTGSPYEAIQANLPEVQQGARLDEYEKMLAGAPATRRFMTVPQNAAMGNDDVGPLTEVEKAIRSFMDGGPRKLPRARSAVMNSQEYSAEVRRVLADNPALDETTARALVMNGAMVDNQMPRAGAVRGPEASTGSVVSGLIGAARRMPETFDRQLGYIAADILGLDQTQNRNRLAALETRNVSGTPAFETATGQGLYAGGVSTIQNAPGIALSIATGSPAPALTLAGVQSSVPAYSKYRERGASGGMAAVGALSEGAVEVATELLPMQSLLKVFGKGGQGAAMQFLKSQFQEQWTEQIATVAQDAIDTAIANPNKTWAEYVAERPGAAYQTFLATLVQTGAVTIAHTAAQKVTGAAFTRNEEANRAEEAAAAAENIVKAVAASKLVTRDAESFQEFVNQVAEDSDTPTELFIDATALTNTLNQAGITMERLAMVAPAVAAQLRAASFVPGADIRVPVAEFAAAGADITTPLIDHLRETPTSPSRAEARKYLATEGAQILADVEAELGKLSKDVTFRQQMDSVTARFEAELNAAGRYRPEVNKAFATFMGNYYAVQAARAGMPLEDFLNKYQLRVTGKTGQGAQTLEQGGTLDTVRAQWDAAGIRNSISEKDGTIELGQIIVPEGARGAGAGTQAMQQLLAYADATGQRVVLTPSADFGGTKSRLVKFYKGLGFVENKGRSKDFTTRATMIREPKGTLAQSGRAQAATNSIATTVERAQAAVADFLGSDTLPNALGRVVTASAADIKATWEPLIGRNVQMESEGDAGAAQAFYDPASKTVFLIADNIRAGDEAAVLTHELMHKHGQAALGKAGWDKLHGVISTWANAPEDSDERAVYQYASSKVRAVGEQLSSQEMFPYAVEAAIKMGVQPSKKAKAGTVSRWLNDVQTAMKTAWDKVTGKPEAFGTQDLVNLAYGIAQMENPALAPGQRAKAAINPVAVAQQSADPDTGLPQFAGSNGLFIGFAAPTERLEFIPTDDSLQMLNFVIMRDGQMIGSADLLFEGDKLAALYDIELDASGRGKGDGAAVIQTLLGADPLRDVNISNIVESARGFWESVGVPTQNLGPGEAYDGTLNWQTYTESRAGKRAARGNDGDGAGAVRSAEPGAAGPGQSGDGQADNRLNQSAVDQTATPQFKKWFGDSVVTDTGTATGSPLVVYHGTTGDITQFDAKRRGENTGAQSAGMGFFFTDDTQTAESYANFAATSARVAALVREAEAAEKRGNWDLYDQKVTEYEALDASFNDSQNRLAGQNVLPVYLAIQNPLVVDAQGENAEGFDIPAAIKKAMRGKHDGVVIQNLDDAAGLSNRPATHYVIFNPGAIKSAVGNDGNFDPTNPNIVNQGEGAPRATLNFASDITQAPSVIALLEGADLSSFLHESGHFFLEVQADLAARIQLRMSFGDTVSEAERGIVADMNTLLAWFGVTDMPEASALDQWAMKTLEERREAHETFARGFERYAMEGKAPTQELAGLFNKFRSWLVSIYQKLASLNVTLTDDVRGVMDRMLASDQAIAEAQAARNMGPLFQSPEQAGMTPAEYDTYQFLGERATAAASEELDARLMKDMKWLSRAKSKAIKAAQEEAAQLRRDTEIEVRREVMAQPIYQAWQILTGKGLNAEDRLLAEKAKGKAQTLDPAVDNLFAAIAKLGGLDKGQAQTQWGVEDKLESGVFGAPVLRVEGGLGIDAMAERLVEEGYLMPDTGGRADLAKFAELFDDQRRGVDRYSVQYEFNLDQDGAPIEAVDLTNRFAKLNTEELRRRYGTAPDAVWRILSERRMTNDTGLDPDLLAESIPGGGFTSGDELVRKLAAAPPPRQVIEEEVDQRMMERYGDITSAEALSQAADEAVHNELRARVIATELKALQKAGQVLSGDRNTTSVLAKAAKEYAAQVIARQRVRDLRPSQYTAAEARSAKLAEQALGKDMAEAALHKRNQLINNYAARAAYDAQDEVKAMQVYFRKFDKRRDSIDAGYQDQIEALLERFDFKPASLKAIDKRKSFAAWYEEQAAGDNPPDVPEYLLDEAGRKSYKDMTVEELRGLRDTVKQIEHQGRLKNKLLLARDQRDFDAAATAMANSIVEHGGEAREVNLEGPNPVTDWFAGVAASHRKLASLFRQMDGNKDDGPMYDLIGRGMNERGTMEDVMVEKATVALRDIYAPLMKLRGGITGARSKLYIPEIDASLTRGGRLAVALNWGNEANRQRIMDGDKWSAGQVQAILKTLTPVELKFVNDVWAYIDSYWEDIAAKEKRLTGVEPEKVQPLPFTQMAADGTEVQMRGGYYPLKYDTDRSDRADTQEAAQAAKEMMQGVMTRSTTRRGHTKERLKEVKRAVRKDLNVITQHVTQVTHDLAWHEWLIDTNKLLKDERVVSAIRDYYGPKVLKTIRDDVLGIATADVVPQTDVDKALLSLRGNVTRATMGASITTAFLQPFGLTQSMVRIGPQHVLRGIARWGGDAARMENTVEWIRGKSEFMRLRAKTFNKELREIRGSVAGKSATMRVVDAGLFALMQKMQLVADVPTWIGQYEKSTAEGLDEAAAVAMADRAVLESQGGGATKDLAEVQRKHPMLTQFYSYFSVTLNLAAEQTAATDFKNPAAVAGWLGDMALLMVIPAILPAFIMHALKGGGDEDDEKDWAKRIAQWQLGYLMGTVVGVRELSGAVSGFDYAGPPVGRIIADIGKAGKQTAQGEVDEPAVMAYIRLMGTAFGIPTVQALRSYKGWKAWDEGQEGAGPQSVLFGPPPRD
jgi:GNAT superfamily N-acetyltransferase